jgi:membrane associated rhomboid family serine protease
MITIFIILLNLIVSYRAYQVFEVGGMDRDAFLLRPFQLSKGKNIKGAILSQFSHVEFSHFLFNMLTLYFFGPVIERTIGILSFLIIYILSGIAAIVLTYIQRKDDPMYSALGASGCISGILFASIVIYPQMSLYMFFIPIPIPGPIFAFLYLAYSLYSMNEGGSISHEAHLGGAMMGFLMGGYFAGGYQNFVNRIYEIFT